jgi:hypothetical protein
LAGDSPREALEKFIERFRKPIACVVDAYVFGSGDEPGATHSVSALPPPGHDGQKLPLHAEQSGRPDLFLELTHQYTIAHFPDDRERGPYKVQTSRYIYEVFDCDGREILLYHWHPEGVSRIRHPHLHTLCAQPLDLSRPRTDEKRRIYPGNAHLSTSRVLLEDVIEVLIEDFGVAPRDEFRDSWRDIFHENREAVKRGSTWSWRTDDDA